MHRVTGLACRVVGSRRLNMLRNFHISGNAPLSITSREFRTFEAPDVVLVE